MSDVVDLAARRFAAAKDSSETRPIDALREALRRMEAGEFPATDIIIVGLYDEDDGDQVECFHGGPATNNARIGMLYRAQAMLLPAGLGGHQ